MDRFLTDCLSLGILNRLGVAVSRTANDADDLDDNESPAGLLPRGNTNDYDRATQFCS